MPNATATTKPATANESWGFWGTMGEQAAAAWPLAIASVSTATGEDAEAVRLFLDSRHGRHYADDVLNALHGGAGLQDAVNAAKARWMTWRIGSSTSRSTGIPRGLPYLVGFVISEQLAAEAAMH